jgi:UDP-N-acetyl-D-glucosamine dehydrogenase
MTEPASKAIETLIARLADRTARVGVIGLGYVGLPLAAAAGRAGFAVTGFDIDPVKAARLNRADSYIDAVSGEQLAALIAADRFEASADFAGLADCDVAAICVPTPLTRQREPDLSFVQATVVKPLLEAGGLVSGRDFLLAYSPEREDPGNAAFDTRSIPKVVAGDGPLAARAAEAFYGAVVDKVTRVSTLDTAEAVKITENVFRAVNIALVNELKMVFDRMGVDVWEVIEAAKTKPFGYMPFYPGPGLGGHCIPIDPFYLTWKSREYDMPTRFIELAGEINLAMPRYVLGRLEAALDARLGKSLGSARVLIVGLAYKRNIADVRESPTFKLMTLLEDRGAKVDFHDPHVGMIPPTREHAAFTGRRSAPLSCETLRAHDAVLIATDHDAVDYALIAREAPLIVDTRNAFERRGLAGDQIVKA